MMPTSLKAQDRMRFDANCTVEAQFSSLPPLDQTRGVRALKRSGENPHELLRKLVDQVQDETVGVPFCVGNATPIGFWVSQASAFRNRYAASAKRLPRRSQAELDEAGPTPQRISVP